jgi:hypothetical protein
MKFEVLKAVKMLVLVLTLKMESVCFSETLVTATYKSIRRYNPEENIDIRKTFSYCRFFWYQSILHEKLPSLVNTQWCYNRFVVFSLLMAVTFFMVAQFAAYVTRLFPGADNKLAVSGN